MQSWPCGHQKIASPHAAALTRPHRWPAPRRGGISPVLPARSGPAGDLDPDSPFPILIAAATISREHLSRGADTVAEQPLTSNSASTPHADPSSRPLHPGNHAGSRADTPGCTPDSAAHAKPGDTPGTGTGTPSSGDPHRSLTRPLPPLDTRPGTPLVVPGRYR